MLQRKFLALTLLIFSACFNIFSQENLIGNALSESVSARLKKKGFSPQVQELSQTGMDDFAYNIIISFPEKEIIDDATNSRRNEVIFCFKQEDFNKNENVILDFLNYLQNLSRSWKASVLFSAFDERILEKENPVKGTKVFAESIADPDDCCAIMVDFDSNQQPAIYTGSISHITPLWLTRRIMDAGFDMRLNFDFKDQLSAIYRLGIVKGKERLAYFFENNVPAIEISLSGPEQFSLLRHFAGSYTVDGTEEWDMHYIYISRGNIFKAFFLNERIIIITCLSLGILTILLLCIFSFVGKHGNRQKYEFIKFCYMIPFTLAITFLSLYLGQFTVGLLSKIINMNPVIQYGIKLIFSMIFISIFFVVQGILKISITAFLYGYLITIVSIFNIFLFSTRDLTLFIIFVTEYIIIYLSRRAKRISSVIFYFLLMLLPFLPYAVIIIKNARDSEIMNTVFTGITGNILLAFAIFPFQITWMRIMVFANVYAGIKGYTLRKTIIRGIISTLFILAFIFMMIFCISRFLYKAEERENQKIHYNIIEEDQKTLSASFNKNVFSGMSTNHIKIESSKAAILYEVELTGSGNSYPLYDSIYDYDIITNDDGSTTYQFIIPNYPPEKIRIDYAAALKTEALITVRAYYAGDEKNTARLEKRELKVD